MIVSKIERACDLWENRGTTKDGPGGATNTVIPGLTTDGGWLMAHTMPRPDDSHGQAL